MKLTEVLSLVKDTQELVIGSGVINTCSEYIYKYWPECSPMIVADTNTWKAAGQQIKRELSESGLNIAEPLIFETPPYLHADYRNVEIILEKAETASNPVLIAVGSGTVNDLVKRAAFELNSSYLTVGTAASMDGYCSSGAALSKGGRKQTMECGAPKVIIADTDILVTAPPEASAAGYGDLASKLTAGADWLIADFTGDDPIEEKVWDIIQPNLDGWLSNPEKTAEGDPQSLSAIFEGLNFSGLAMQALGLSRAASKASRAASGAEHMFSHIWEMSGHLGSDGNPVSHGFQVSVGILCVCALMDEVFDMDADEIDIEAALEAYPDWETRAAEVEEQMGNLPSWEEYIDICREKHLTKDELRAKLVKVKADWNELRDNVKNRLPSYSKTYRMLKTAGCPVKPEDINLKRETAISTYKKAQCMRNRYTILDLAYELGVLSKCIQSIEDSSQYLN